MTQFYDKALVICQKYFSSSGKDFLDRQIKFHLKKTPDTITPDDKESLAKWFKISGALLMGEGKAKQMSDEILGQKLAA